MLSKRNFFMILTMFLIILVLFLSSAVLKEYFNDYEINHWAEAEKIPLENSAEVLTPADTLRHVVYVGSQETPYYHQLQEWADYRKMSYKETVHVLSGIGLAKNYKNGDAYLLLDGSVLETNTEQTAKQLLEYVQNGGIVIFCTLPSYKTIEDSEDLTYLLGIQRFRGESVKLQEIRLYGGFLLGGETHYLFEETQDPERTDMIQEVPWYDVSSRTKTYMVGYVSAEEQERMNVLNEDMPAIIWRTSAGSGYAFAVNGDFMNGAATLGVLDAMAYETRPYSLYTVVNAQNLSVTGFPDLTNENEAAFTQRYGFTAEQFCRDILWPSLVAASYQGDWKMTAFFTAKQHSDSPGEADSDKLIEYLKYLNEESAEMGIALGRMEDSNILSSLDEERRILDSMNLTYAFTCGFIRSENDSQLSRLFLPDGSAAVFPDIRTVVSQPDSEQRVVSRLTEEITSQSITMDGYRYTYSDDFRLKSLQTALAYSNVQADIYRIIWPETDKDFWESASEKLASHINTYWKPFLVFEKTTITESDRRVRLFLNGRILDSASPVENGQRITIQAENFSEEAWLILRTHGQSLTAMEGGTWQQIEKDAYLLHLTSGMALVTLQSEDGTHYYE